MNPTASRRSRVRSSSSSWVRSTSPIQTSPEVGESRPARQCMNVDLPDPDGPMMAVNRSRSMTTSTASTARTLVSPSPYTLVREAVRAAGTPVAVGADVRGAGSVLIVLLQMEVPAVRVGGVVDGVHHEGADERTPIVRV